MGEQILKKRRKQNRGTELKNTRIACIPELPDGKDAAAAGGRGSHAEERAVGEAAPGRRRDEHIGAHLPEDLGPQSHEAPVLDRDTGAHRHLPPDLRINRPAGSKGSTAGCSIGICAEPLVGYRDGGELSPGPASAWHRSSSCFFI